MVLDIIFCEYGATLDTQALCAVLSGATLQVPRAETFGFGAGCQAGCVGGPWICS